MLANIYVIQPQNMIVAQEPMSNLMSWLGAIEFFSDSLWQRPETENIINKFSPSRARLRTSEDETGSRLLSRKQFHKSLNFRKQNVKRLDQIA